MKNKFDIYQDLHQIIPVDMIKIDEPLKKYTFTKTGGHADLFITPKTYLEVRDIVKYAKAHHIPITYLGNGSNLIVKDGGVRGIVIHFEHLSSISREGNKVVAQSGATIISTSHYAQENQLSGLEFACGIPGTVGGALYMNAGAYGGEVSDVLLSAIIINENGELKTVLKDEVGLEYRSSLIASNDYVVLEATFLLKSGDYNEIKEKMDELTYLRESKQPLEYPSCGSVFKRPKGYFAGKLIQDSGLQGVQMGGAQVSLKHAGFIVNVDHATATDYVNLIHHVQKIVKETFGVDLETEVKIIGEDS